MYSFFLSLHSWLRWFIILFLILNIFSSFIALIKRDAYTKFHKIISISLLSFVHLQLLGGLILYVALSPLIKIGTANLKSTMGDKVLRYWTVEHIVAMLLVVVFVQVGYSVSKRTPEALAKHRAAFIFYLLSFVMLMAMLPWPYKEYGRVLFRFSI